MRALELENTKKKGISPFQFKMLLPWIFKTRPQLLHATVARLALSFSIACETNFVIRGRNHEKPGPILVLLKSQIHPPISFKVDHKAPKSSHKPGWSLGSRAQGCCVHF